MKDSVEYLGHVVDSSGVSTSPKKVEAVKNAPVPMNLPQLRSFLDLVHYYGKFIPNLSSILQPLNSLLQKNQRWNWSTECQTAFELAKDKLSSAPVLAHYNPSLPLRLAGDASSYGLGAVISHIYPDGTERPVCYAS